MADLTTRTVPIAELCEVERANAETTYPAGTCCVALSATNETVAQIDEDGPVASRFAVMVPRDGVEPDYLKVALDRAFPRWLSAHRTGINLQLGELRSLRVEWHASEEARRAVVDTASHADKLMEAELETIAGLEGLKRYLLSRMFV